MKFPLLFLFIFLSATFANSQTPPESDFQFWNETQLIFPLVTAKDSKGKEVDRVVFFLSGNLRFGRNYTRFVDERIGFGFDFKPNKFLTVTPSYLYRAGQPFANRKEYESRFRLAATLDKRWPRVTFRNRNLIEYRMRNSRSDSVRYRNRPLVQFSVRKNEKEIFAPYVSDEVFYDFQEKAWTRNELTLGVNRKLAPNVSADFFYLWQRNRGRVLRDVNALGVNLKFTVK